MFCYIAKDHGELNDRIFYSVDRLKTKTEYFEYTVLFSTNGSIGLSIKVLMFVWLFLIIY